MRQDEPAVAAGAKRILVIEDNEDNLRLVRMLLLPLRADITSRADGVSGLEAAGSASFDLILLDIQLPGMDGYAVARALRCLPHLQRVPIVAVTSYAMAGDREKTIEAGCTGYIEKPLDPETFATQVASYLDGGVI